MTNLPFFNHDIVRAAAIFLLVLLALLFLRSFIARQMGRLAQRPRLGFLGAVEHIVNATRLPFLLGVAALAGAGQLELQAGQQKWIDYAWVVILVLQVALWGNRAISVTIGGALEKGRTVDPSGATHLVVLGLIGRILLWSTAMLVALDNLGFNITTLMASLGIGGIAVALAVQNILGDVFSSISIALDKPFEIGDFIIVDDFLGTVEYVGLKTTRLRSLGGEQIIFSNAELLKCRIRNYKRMQERRVVFEFRIACETPAEKLEQASRLVADIIGRREGVRFDRAHFKSFLESALLFEVVYYMLTPDYNQYMDMQQSINLEMMREFRKLGIQFAYPNRIIHLKGASGRGAGLDRMLEEETAEP